jgi:N-acetylneuraminic acid mutarotase
MPFASNLRFWTVLFTGWVVAFSASAAFWATNAPVNTPRYSHTATLLNDGRVIIAGGYGGSYLATTEIYDPFTGSCSPGPNMTTNRSSHTATLLPNGKVLVVGGSIPAGFVTYTLATAELFDPVAGTWTLTGSLNVPRAGHTATLLANGKVLVAGGSFYDNNAFTSTNLPSAEIYDPATGLWSQANPMSSPRSGHTATLLRSGKVLVAGGYYTNSLASAELFDPSTGGWTAAGTIPGGRGSHSAALLPNGKVLVAGGANGDSIATAALYDPVANSWAAANPMAFKRQSFAMNLLPNGKVLVSGGWYQITVYTNAEIFDPATGSWTATASNNVKRYGATSTVLANGRVLVVAGADESGFDAVTVGSVELYDSTTDSFASTASMLAPRNGHITTLLATGKVLIAGGSIDTGNESTNAAELFDPATGNYTATGSMLASHSGHTATLLANGKVLITDTGTNSTSAELYDPVAGTWSAAGPTPLFNPGRAVALLNDGRVLVAGGLTTTGIGVSSNCYLFNPSNSSWTATGSMTNARGNFTATLLTNGNVLVAGGVYPDVFNNGTLNPFAAAEVYDSKTGTWSATASMNSARASHTANLLPNGKVLVTGSPSELYDPSTATWTRTGSNLVTRTYAPSIQLLNGQILVIAGVVGTTGGFISTPINTNSTEIFDPTTGKWRPGPSLTYSPSHTAAALLPNGKVLVNGGITNSGFSGGVVAFSQVYDPGLGFASTNQPQITSAPSNIYSNAPLALGGSLFRGVSEATSDGTGSSPSDHPVVQLRAIESTRVARLVVTSWSSNACAVVVPTNFPQGPAMLTIFVNGIYSSSALMNFSTATAVSFSLVNPIKLGDGTFRFNFTNTPGVSFTAFASTNVAAPSASWLNLGAPTETSAGNYQFTDSGTATNRMRFYRVVGN